MKFKTVLFVFAILIANYKVEVSAEVENGISLAHSKEHLKVTFHLDVAIPWPIVALIVMISVIIICVFVCVGCSRLLGLECRPSKCVAPGRPGGY